MSTSSNKKAAEVKSKAVLEKDKTTKASKQEKAPIIFPFVQSVAPVSTNSKSVNKTPSPHNKKHSKSVNVTHVNLLDDLKTPTPDTSEYSSKIIGQFINE